MPKAILIVESQPSDPSREDEYVEWYRDVHLPEVLEVPGFLGARRYKLRAAGGVAADPTTPTYVTVYEIEADDVAAPVKELGARSAAGRTSRSDVMQMDPRPTVALYELLE
jgi:hypothetical protein